ncbi:creatininase family protein [Lichenihabitans psoromatis]|uniref:creatininase family protein n=1 Tax=Lichenihabitans psoromatis TaxID=2528642 RepID=UPI00103674AB|nr:creatininase family protein [Lichenihabitans psoromatis]
MIETVRWERLKPEEFDRRMAQKPVVYLPLGLCEPHGHIAPFGLDTIKAEYLCDAAARRFGGIVAPTQSYHIHETGYHAPWLRAVMGDINPRLAALPPHVVLETFLYQLRAFRNAGFAAAVVVSGHHGGNQFDLRTVADAFSAAYPFEIFACSDPELVEGVYEGDHAGYYEVSQLLAIEPDLIDLSRAGRVETDPLGRFAQNPDAADGNAEAGRHMLDLAVERLGQVVAGFSLTSTQARFIPMDAIEPIWAAIAASRAHWRTLNA